MADGSRDGLYDGVHYMVEDGNMGVEGRMDGLRRDLASAGTSMGMALDRLEDCVTYLDGFRSGALMASGDVPGVSGIQNLFCDLRGVEDSMERVHSMLEDMALGDDHE